MISRRAFAVAALGGAVAMTLAGCGRTETFRYKMTVDVETPNGVRSGTAVREVWYSDPGNYPSIGENRPQWRVTGEAVAVDLPGRVTLSALLTGDDGDVDYAGHSISTIFRMMDRSGSSRGRPHELWPNVPIIGEPITNPVPKLVTFRDIKDPRSVKRVDPEALDKAFGPGVRLKRITVQATDENVTAGIKARLPSYGPESGFDSWYRKLSYGDPNAVGLYDFTRGLEK